MLSTIRLVPPAACMPLFKFASHMLIASQNEYSIFYSAFDSVNVM